MGPQPRSQLLAMAVDLAAVADHPNDSDPGFDRLSRSDATHATEAAHAALRADSRIRPLLEQRDWGRGPQPAPLRDLPADSLGGCDVRWFCLAGLNSPPDPILEAGTAAADLWLHQRMRRTHDLWHVVTGRPPTIAGAAALNMTSLRSPGGAMLVGTDRLHRCLVGGSQEHPDVSLAVAFGLQIGLTGEPMLAQRWEGGWERSLQSWREQLGIAALQRHRPFRSRP